MSVCQSLTASFTQRSQPYSPLFFSVISLSSLPVSIFHVLSFTVSQLTKHFFFTFICFSSPSLISPLLSQSLTVLHSATIFLPLFSFFSLSNLSNLIFIFLMFTVETSALTKEIALQLSNYWVYSSRYSTMAESHQTSLPKNWSLHRCHKNTHKWHEIKWKSWMHSTLLGSDVIGKSCQKKHSIVRR